MRIAALTAAALVVIGVYLAVAASVGLPAGAIGIGVLAISATVAVAMVASERSSVRA